MKPTKMNMLLDFEDKPTIFSKMGDELQLSGSALAELLQAVLDKKVSFRFRAKGFSMSPFIKDNDVITVSPLTGDSTKSGDVVAFIRPIMKKLVIHRVVGKKGKYSKIKGDKITDADDLIPVANILGRVTKVERNGKEIFLGLGPERFLIAFLSRKRLLFPLVYPIRRMVRPIVRRTSF